MENRAGERVLQACVAALSRTIPALRFIPRGTRKTDAGQLDRGNDRASMGA
jgi:hypothetical protein